jgi:hypothetical protein
MDDQDKIKYLEILEQVLGDEWIKTQDIETKLVVDKIREKLQRLR